MLAGPINRMMLDLYVFVVAFVLWLATVAYWFAVSNLLIYQFRIQSVSFSSLSYNFYPLKGLCKSQNIWLTEATAGGVQWKKVFLKISQI